MPIFLPREGSICCAYAGRRLSKTILALCLVYVRTIYLFSWRKIRHRSVNFGPRLVVDSSKWSARVGRSFSAIKFPVLWLCQTLARIWLKFDTVKNAQIWLNVVNALLWPTVLSYHTLVSDQNWRRKFDFILPARACKFSSNCLSDSVIVLKNCRIEKERHPLGKIINMKEMDQIVDLKRPLMHLD